MSFLIAAGSAYLAILVLLFVFQRALLYHPDQSVPKPAEYAVSHMKAVDIPAEDGLLLHGWWQPPAKTGLPVVVYHHGNAGHIGGRAFKIRSLIASGYGVLLMSYRYNAGRGGSASEDNLIGDGRSALRWLEAQGVPAENTVLYGESLGSGIAVALASERPVKAVVLEAPYNSVAAVAQGHYWYVPAFWLVKDSFRSDLRISQVSAPVLIVHGKQDRTIPIRYGRALAAAGDPALIEMREIDRASHADLYDFGMAEIVTDFLAQNGAR